MADHIVVTITPDILLVATALATGIADKVSAIIITAGGIRYRGGQVF